MIDPITLASITSAVVNLRTDYLRGVTTEAGKSTWKGIKSLLGWTSDPASEEIPKMVANALVAYPDTVEKLQALLEANHVGSAPLVGRIEGGGRDKIIVADNIVVEGDFKM